jgi:hypothetical protein
MRSARCAVGVALEFTMELALAPVSRRRAALTLSPPALCKVRPRMLDEEGV